MDEHTQISKFLNRELTAEEQLKFEEKLEQDETFAEEVKATVVLNVDFNLKQKARWKAMKEDMLVVDLPTNHRRSRWIRPLAIAASLLLLLSIGTLLFLQNSLDNIVNQQLALKHNAPMTIRGENQTIDSNWESIKQAYTEEDYATVETLTETEKTATSSNLGYTFYLGLAQLYQEKYTQAISQFQLLVEAETIYAEEARWFLALAHIKNGNESAASSLLQQIAAANGWKSAEASQLLKKLQ